MPLFQRRILRVLLIAFLLSCSINLHTSAAFNLFSNSDFSSNGSSVPELHRQEEVQAQQVQPQVESPLHIPNNQSSVGINLATWEMQMASMGPEMADKVAEFADSLTSTGLAIRSYAFSLLTQEGQDALLALFSSGKSGAEIAEMFNSPSSDEELQALVDHFNSGGGGLDDGSGTPSNHGEVFGGEVGLIEEIAKSIPGGAGILDQIINSLTPEGVENLKEIAKNLTRKGEASLERLFVTAITRGQIDPLVNLLNGLQPTDGGDPSVLTQSQQEDFSNFLDYINMGDEADARRGSGNLGAWIDRMNGNHAEGFLDFFLGLNEAGRTRLAVALRNLGSGGFQAFVDGFNALSDNGRDRMASMLSNGRISYGTDNTQHGEYPVLTQIGGWVNVIANSDFTNLLNKEAPLSLFEVQELGGLLALGRNAPRRPGAGMQSTLGLDQTMQTLLSKLSPEVAERLRGQRYNGSAQELLGQLNHGDIQTLLLQVYQGEETAFQGETLAKLRETGLSTLRQFLDGASESQKFVLSSWLPPSERGGSYGGANATATNNFYTMLGLISNDSQAGAFLNEIADVGAFEKTLAVFSNLNEQGVKMLASAIDQINRPEGFDGLRLLLVSGFLGNPGRVGPGSQINPINAAQFFNDLRAFNPTNPAYDVGHFVEYGLNKPPVRVYGQD